jgi:acetyl-CoA acetyltransferase
MKHVAIAGIGRTSFSRNSGRTTRAMAAEACRLALQDAGLPVSSVDGMVTYQMGDSVSPLDVAYAIGVDELRWAADLSGGGSYAASAVLSAASALRCGEARVVIAYRSLNGRSGHRYGLATGGSAIAGDEQFVAPHGYVLAAQWMAMWAQAHQHKYGSTSTDLGQIVITQRRHAFDNPQAIARQPLSIDQYLSAPWVYEPFRIFDCCYEIDGAIAIVLVTQDVTPDLSSRPVWLLGGSQSHAGPLTAAWHGWKDFTTMYSRSVGERLWRQTGLKPQDIDVACIYDCFSYTVMASLEDLGFCAKGEVGAYFEGGHATHGGDIVVNPHGGLLSEGYIQGFNHFYEAALQLRGSAEGRQVRDAALALVTAGSGPAGSAAILGRDQP